MSISVVIFDGKLSKKLENYQSYGIRLSDCEMWCSENGKLGKWLVRNLAILYSQMEAGVYNEEV